MGVCLLPASSGKLRRHNKKSEALSSAGITRLILSVRGHKVMLDADLARLYGVTTSNLNKAVKRNSSRFPGDFVFQLRSEEASALRFQSGISNVAGRGDVVTYRMFLPNRASLCYPVFLGAGAQSRSTLKS